MSSSGLLHVLAEREDERLNFEELDGRRAALLNLDEYKQFARRYIYYTRNKAVVVEKVIENFRSNDPNLQLEACIAIRKLYFIDKDTNALQTLVGNDDFMLFLVSFFAENVLPQLQYEAVWILAVFYNTLECLPSLVKSLNCDDIVPVLASLLLHCTDDIRRMAFFSLGKLASTSEHVSASVVEHALLPLLTCGFIDLQKTENVQVAALFLLHCSKAIVKSDLVTQVFAELQQILLSIDTKDHGMDRKDNGKTELLVNTTQALASIGISIASQVILNKVVLKLVELLSYKSVSVVNAALDALANFATDRDNRIKVMIDGDVLPDILRLLTGDMEDGGSIKNRAVKLASRMLAYGDGKQIEVLVCYGILYVLLDALRGLPLEEKQEVALAMLGILSRATWITILIVKERLVDALKFLEAECIFSAELNTRCLRARSRFKQRYSSKRKRPWYSV